jgi:hypothetical protein
MSLPDFMFVPQPNRKNIAEKHRPNRPSPTYRPMDYRPKSTPNIAQMLIINTFADIRALRTVRILKIFFTNLHMYSSPGSRTGLFFYQNNTPSLLFQKM